MYFILTYDQKTVLIVEDDSNLRTMLHHTLRKTYRVISAIDAEEALDLIHAYRPDIITLDVGLPGEINGAQLCEYLKDDRRYVNTYIILATGNADAAIDNLREYSHANDFILKPFSPTELLQKIQKAY